MATSDIAIQVGDGPLFVATHVSVDRVGSEIVSSFVFDDGLVRDPTGVAAIATQGTARTLPSMLEALSTQSPALQAALGRPRASLLPPPRPYVSLCEPLRMTYVSAQVLEIHDAVYLAFALIDPHNAPSADPAAGKVPRQRVPAPRVTVSSDTFLAWVTAVAAAAETSVR